MVSLARMWEDTFEGITGTVKLKSGESKSKAPEMSRSCSEISGVDEKKEETRLECPVCFEPFDMPHNAPLVLWCGHTLCKSCVLRLQRAVLKFQKLRPIGLPFFVSCPWCSSFSLKLSFKGNLKFPRKNYFVLWMIDGSKTVSCTTSNNLSCVGSNRRMLNQEELVPTSIGFEAWDLLGSVCKSLLAYSPAQQIFGLGFLVILMALYAARVSTFLLALYAFTFLFGSAFLLFPKFCLPGIGFAG